MPSFLGFSFGFIPVSDTNASSEITGSGTVNTLAMFTAGQVIGNSFLSQNGNNVRLALGKFFSNVSGNSQLDLGGASDYFLWTNDAGAEGDAVISADTNTAFIGNTYGSLSILNNVLQLSSGAGIFLATTAGVAANSRGVQMNGSLMYLYHALNITNQTTAIVNTQNIAATGSPTFALFTGAAHTTLTAGTEAIDINFNLKRVVQFSTGAITTQRAFYIQAPVYAFVGASTITNAATFVIEGPPIPGTNATITNGYALWVQSGRAQFSGTINGMTLTNSTGTFTLANGKTVTISNTLTFTGTDSSSVAFGGGGTVAYAGRNSQSGTTYTVVAGDIGKIVGLSNVAARTLTLPAANTMTAGGIVWIKDEAGTAGTANITIARTGSDTIDGTTSDTLNSNYQARGYYPDGVSAWFII